MHETKPQPTQRGLTYRGRPVDLIEFAGAVLVVFFLSFAFGTSALESMGLSSDDATRFAVLIMPLFIASIMAARYAAAALEAIIGLLIMISRLLSAGRKDNGRME